MKEIKEIRDGKGVFDLRVNPANYPYDAEYSPISAFRQTLTPIDDTNPVQVDAARLMLVFNGLRSKDFKYYFFVLSQLVANNIPIRVNMDKIRRFTGDKYTSVTFRGLERLCKQGILFKVEHRASTYIVNPIYAWRGNRLNYLDTEAFMITE